MTKPHQVRRADLYTTEFPTGCFTAEDGQSTERSQSRIYMSADAPGGGDSYGWRSTAAAGGGYLWADAPGGGDSCAWRSTAAAGWQLVPLVLIRKPGGPNHPCPSLIGWAADTQPRWPATGQGRISGSHATPPAGQGCPRSGLARLQRPTQRRIAAT